MDTASLVSTIIAKEWDFFQQTQNVGGRASCQDSPVTFGIMRGSQFACWPEAALETYNRCLDQAKEEGRNPVSEKYAYMMRRTWPEEFARIEELLPPVSEAKRELVRAIVDLHVAWEAECDKLFPHVRAQGRPLRSSQDSRYATSFETYLEGELSTYDMATLKHLAAHARQAQAQGDNLAIRNLDHMARQYGYASIEDLEAIKAGKKTPAAQA